MTLSDGRNRLPWDPSLTSASGITALMAAVAAADHVVLLFSFVVGNGFFSLEGQVITVVPGLLFLWIFVTGLVMLREASPLGCDVARTLERPSDR